ncbi:MAG TPA: hypothetical protein DDX40_03005 [Rikenellaceae bacterium]|nr:hypothetical protein [Rikenellaceae bacterium]
MKTFGLRIFSLALCLFLIARPLAAKDREPVVKAGHSFVPFPMVGFDGAKGFLFGGLMNVYDFGDGSTYPNPKSSAYLEVSGYTGGSKTFVASYDSGKLLAGVRMNLAASYCADNAMEFFGFGGRRTLYDTSLEDGFYKYDRATFNFKADFSGRISDRFSWEAGYHFNQFMVKDYKPQDSDYALSLFGLYKVWGIIPSEDKSKDCSSAIRIGLVYDSRDYEGVPTKGILAKAHIIAAPKFLGSSESYLKVHATLRHYIPVVKENLVFAYRLDYQESLGDAPWYVIPFYTPGGPVYDNSAVGGYRTVRGLMYNRVAGPAVGFVNAELRWKFASFTIWNQDIGLMLSGFCDGISTLKSYDITNHTGAFPKLYAKYIDTSRPDIFHLSTGAALKLILNRNFVLNVEYACALSTQDGTGVMYFNTGFYF